MPLAQQSDQKPTPISPFAVLMELIHSLRDGQAYLSSHIREVLGLVPEVIRVDLYNFELLVGAATFIQPASIRVPSDFDFELTGIRGYFQDPGVNIPNFTRVSYNMREAGRNFDIFTQPISMANLVTNSGPAQDIEFPRGLYLFRGGAEIQPNFQRVATTGPFVGPDIQVGVTLIGNLIRKK